MEPERVLGGDAGYAGWTNALLFENAPAREKDKDEDSTKGEVY